MGKNNKEIFMKSSDCGVNFNELAATTVYKGSADYCMPYIERGCIGSNIISNGRGIATSVIGASRVFVAAPNLPISGYYPDMQNYCNEIVYIECGVSYTAGDYQDLLYSDDNGATWNIVQSPVANTEDPDGGYIEVPQGTETETIYEPQVWPM